MVCFRYKIVNTLHKCDNKDDNNNSNNNNNKDIATHHIGMPNIDKRTIHKET